MTRQAADSSDADELLALSFDELWELFPIPLVDPKDSWEAQYRKIEATLARALEGTPGLRISHVGSTAIPNIKGKDIVDVLVEVACEVDLGEVSDALKGIGFIQMSEQPDRISMNLGYGLQGYADEVYHVHLRFLGDNDELYFRDYLREHPEVARDYEDLKLALLQEHGRDRDAYTEGKTAFVRRWVAKARTEYGERY